MLVDVANGDWLASLEPCVPSLRGDINRPAIRSNQQLLHDDFLEIDIYSNIHIQSHKPSSNLLPATNTPGRKPAACSRTQPKQNPVRPLKPPPTDTHKPQQQRTMSRPAPTDTTISTSDPTLAASCLDFLLIELVPLAQRITDQLAARDAALREEYKRSQIFHDQPPPPSSAVASGAAGDDHGGAEVKTAATTFTDVGSVGGAPTDNTTTAAGGVDDETRDAVFWRLDGLGYRVGQGLVER